MESSETRPAFLLTVFLLLGMAAVICLKAVSDAIFLSEFNATRLSYVDLAVTILVGALVNYYLRWSGRVPLGSLVAGTQLCLAASIVAIWLLRRGARERRPPLSVGRHLRHSDSQPGVVPRGSDFYHTLG